MKKITFLLLIIFATANIYSQTYTISFTGTGAATTVDSVKVENLTQSTTVKWHSGDVLQLLVSTGINELGTNKENLQVFPNPMQGQAEISFYAKQADNAKILIYDIAGKKVLQTEDKLIQGFQKYKLTDLKQGAYFINISGINYFYSSKLISQNTNSNEVKIKFISNENPEILTNKYKSSKATVTMNYTTGDNLRFTGYSGTYSAIVNDVPTGSKTITFAFGNTATVTDIDGNIYDTVHIGTQVWLQQNLKVTKYNNGNLIPNITDDMEWYNSTTGGYCNYNNDVNNGNIYGKMYNYHVIEDARKICPNGWHVPSDAEWTTLTNYLGGSSEAGGKLKETGTIHWNSPNTGATNESGFTALPGGMRFVHGEYNVIGLTSYFWSSTTSSSTEYYHILLNNTSPSIMRISSYNEIGRYIRCLKD